MHVEELQQLYEYNYWANARLFDVLSRLTPEEFTRSVAGSYESIRNTLVHVLSAEWGWLDRCGGPPRGEKLKSEDYPTVDSVLAQWKTVEANMRSFLAGISDDDLARVIEFQFPGGPKQAIPAGDLLRHAAIHGAHHRGQVAMLLRMLGHVPGNFDYLIYMGSR